MALDFNLSRFAGELNINAELVKQWENGRIIPSSAIQSNIFDLCQNHNLSVYDLLLSRIQIMAEEIERSCGSDEIVLFHGSKCGITGKITPKSRSKCDFGQGFYMGDIPSQGLTLILDYPKPKFYIMTLNLKGLRCLKLPTNLDWALLIAYNRKKMDRIAGTPLFEKYQYMMNNYDLIIGSIANNRIYSLFESFFNDEITATALLNRMPYSTLGTQYAAITEKGCQAVSRKKTIQLFKLHKLAINQFGEKASSTAESTTTIIEDEQRKGLLFSEILKKAGENNESL